MFEGTFRLVCCRRFVSPGARDTFRRRIQVVCPSLPGGGSPDRTIRSRAGGTGQSDRQVPAHRRKIRRGTRTQGGVHGSVGKRTSTPGHASRFETSTGRIAGHKRSRTPMARCANAYVDAIKSSFVAIGCTIGKFSARDAQFAQDLQQRGIPLETRAGCPAHGSSAENIFPGSMAVRLSRSEVWLTLRALVSEIQERPLPADYREYLRKKVVQLARAWAKESAKRPEKSGDAQICLARRSFNSGLYYEAIFPATPAADPGLAPGPAPCLRKKVTSKKAQKRRDDVDYQLA